jgi:hypothetical protein
MEPSHLAVSSYRGPDPSFLTSSIISAPKNGSQARTAEVFHTVKTATSSLTVGPSIVNPLALRELE